MKISDIPLLRLRNQQILNSQFNNPQDLVACLGAVQSQDFSGAKWALGLRIPGSKNADTEKAFNEGKILRTHALRPTWHFVTPENIRWIMELNAPQVKRIMNYYNKKLELDDAAFKKTNSVIEKSLKGRTFLTRTEIAEKLNESGIKASGQRLGHIVSQAELDCIICSGPRKGRQFTYALVDEVAPGTKSFDRDESLLKLAAIFFKSRGPATVKDFAKWSGLTQSDAQKGLNGIKTNFQSEVIEGKEYWFANLKSLIQHPPASQVNHKSALLLPNYDEYISSYSDYSVISDAQTRSNLLKIGNALFWNHMVLDGKIVGSWRRIFTQKEIEVQLAPLIDLSGKELAAFEKAANKFGDFFEMKVSLRN